MFTLSHTSDRQSCVCVCLMKIFRALATASHHPSPPLRQCNDAYSALVVATELAKALNTDVNSLPLSLDISWFEQKAVAVLLTLLFLGVKNIRLGPNLPGRCCWRLQAVGMPVLDMCICSGVQPRLGCAGGWFLPADDAFIDGQCYQLSAGAAFVLEVWGRLKHSLTGPHPCALALRAAFLTPDATALLVEKFNIMKADTKNPAGEIERMMSGAGEVSRGR